VIYTGIEVLPSKLDVRGISDFFKMLTVTMTTPPYKGVLFPECAALRYPACED